MKRPRVFLPAIASGGLLWLAFFPINLGPVAFVALAPLLTLVRAEPVARWRRYLAAYAGGLVFFVIALKWIRVAHPMMATAWVVLSIYCALSWPLAIALMRRLDRIGLRVPRLGVPMLSATAPIAWVAVELLRAHFPTGFPFLKWIGWYHPVGFGWYFLGHTQHAVTPLIQIADVTGVYGTTFLVMAVNGASAEWLMRFNATRWLLGWPKLVNFRGWTRAFGATAMAVGIVAVPTAYGFIAIVHPPYEKGPRVAAIQASIPQNEKDGEGRNLFTQYDRLCRIAAPKADLVVWPETCFPAGWYGLRNGATKETAPVQWRRDDRFVRDRVAELMTDPQSGWRVPVLLGTSTFDWDGNKEIRANSAVLIDRDGTEAGRYDKIHLVPFGEYVPFVSVFPWLQKFTPYDESYTNSPGQTWSRFPLMVGDRQYTFGTIICFEDSDPAICSPFVATDPVDFLVNISNDGWFDGTELHEQHLAICRFRAVEARRSIVRAVNMGISAIIDPDGRVIALPGDDWGKSKKIAGTVTDRVPLSTRGSLYARIGDAFAWFCLAIALAGFVATRKRKTAKPIANP
jgi:apolipoprotein N-acyltransferase